MYAQLNENEQTRSPESAIPSVPSSKRKPESERKNAKTVIGKNSELRKSLIEENGIDRGNDHASADLEIGLESSSFGETGSLMSSEADPFYVFKEDLLIKLEMVDEVLTRFEHITKNTDSSTIANAKDTKKQLKRHIKNAESTVKDLTMTVRMVEGKRHKFAHIDDLELNSRKNFISSSIDRMKKAKGCINSSKIKSKLSMRERNKSDKKLGGREVSVDEVPEGEDSIENTQARSQLMMQQQDETLEVLDEAVVRVGHMAGNIHEELGHQDKMLRDLQEDLDDAEENLGLVMGKLAEILKTKSKWQLRTIILLSLIVVILFFLVLHT